MNVSFGNPEGAAPVPGTEAQAVTGTVYKEEQQPTTAVTVRQPGALAPGGLVLGDRLPDFDEIILPRVNLVQGIGQLKDSFPQGALVFGQQTVLFTSPIIDKQTGNVKVAGLPPVNLTVLGFRPTRFVEKIAGGARGSICNSEAEVWVQGGTLDYKEWKLKEKDGMKRFEYLADAVVVIRRPEHLVDDDTVFTFLVDGQKYALGMWSMKGTIYTAAAKRVFFTARSLGCLQKGGYPSWNYSVTTRLESFGTNSSWIPVCIPNSKNTPAFMEFAAHILNPSVSSNSTEA